MAEKELILKAQKGDIEAFSEIAKIYQSSVRACLYIRLSSKYEADDLAQEAFIVAFRKIKNFDPDRPFGPWIRSIALKLLQNFIRKHKPVLVGAHSELQEIIDQKISSVYSTKNETEILAALKICVKKLDSSLQELIKQHYNENITLTSLTEKLNIKHSALTMKMHRMREQLRKCIIENTGSCNL